MARAWRTVRVFISSTFRDTQAERDHLVRFVFPRLRDELVKQRIHLIDVDLRWGVTSDQNALEVCRDIIDECHPRFLCILGGRYGFIPQGSDRSITAAEIHYAVLDRQKTPKYSFFYFRDSLATANMVESEPGEYWDPSNSENERKLTILKQTIVAAKLNLRTYSPRWDPNRRRLVNLDAFGDYVYSDLLGSVHEEFGSTNEQQVDEFSERRAAMEAFIAQRTENFVVGSRAPILDRLHTFITERSRHAHQKLSTWQRLVGRRRLPPADDTNGVFCIVGAAGSGKSALLARLVRDFSESSLLVVTHFIGASPGSTDIHRTLRHLCHDLSTLNVDDLPDDHDLLVAKFAQVLENAAASRSVVIVLDALDQLEAAYDAFSTRWLPDALPRGVCVIMSTLPGPALDALRHRRHPPEELALPPLEPSDAEAIVELFTRRFGKRLNSLQLKALMAKTDARTPLYLRTAIEELRTLGSYSEITERIRELPDETTELFRWIMKRLEIDPVLQETAVYKSGADIASNSARIEGRPDQKDSGASLVRRFASFVSVSRFGLSRAELVKLIAPETPFGNIAALERLLRPYLMYRGDLIDFFHSQLRAAAVQEYLPDAAARTAAHAALANHFRNRADPSSDQRWTARDARALSELPHHLAQAGQMRELAGALSSYTFMRAKTEAVGILSLIGDYDLIPLDAALAVIKAGVQVSAHVIAHDSGQLASQLYARLFNADEIIVNGLIRQILECAPQPWLRLLHRPLAKAGGPLIRTFEGHTGEISSIAITLDGRNAVSASWDGSLRIWDLASGATLRTLKGHTGCVNAVVLTPDGMRAVSGCTAGELRVWDLGTGQIVRNLRAPPTQEITGKRAAALSNVSDDKEGVEALAITFDGMRAVSGHSGGMINLWDLQSGRKLRTMSLQSGKVTAVVISPDDRSIIAGAGGTLGIWELDTGRRLATLKEYMLPVNSVAVTRDGRTLIAGSWEGTVDIWDLKSRQQLWRFALRQEPLLPRAVTAVHAVTITQDGRRAVAGAGGSAGDDNSIRVWDLEQGNEVCSLKGHEYAVTALALSPDGKQLFSGSRDNRLKLWNLGNCDERHLVAHVDWVAAIVITPDGQQAVSSSRDSTIAVWSLLEGRVSRTLRGHGDRVEALAINSDLLVSGSMDSTIKVWDITTGQSLTTINNDSAVKAVAITDDNRYVASGDCNNVVKLWELTTGQEVRSLRGHTDWVEAVTFASDGSRLVSGARDNTLRVWNSVTGQEISSFKEHSDWVRSVALLADGRRAVCSSGREVLIWDLVSKRKIVELKGHTNTVEASAVSVDGRFIVSVATDNTVRLWNGGNGKGIATFTADAMVTACAIAPSGVDIVAGDSLGGVLFLRLED
jgi:WD40 repeat protein